MTGAREGAVKPGDVIEGRYRVIKILGAGGMGVVFLAEHALIKRRVAIKLLHAELATNAEVIERFMNEARAAGTLGHPNIVESTDMGFSHGGVPYIVFEYLEGALLTDEIYRVGGFTVRRAVRIAQQIASALYAAHAASIIHRDLKSDNVFLTDKDEALDHVKVLDFGISRFLETDDDHQRPGTVMGTPEFMAPEQITAAERVDRRTDIYALGVILYEMLTARRPFALGADTGELLSRIISDPPPPLSRDDVPDGLADLILHRMLAKDPADRYSSMLDVEVALVAWGAPTEPGGLRRSRSPTAPVIAASAPVAARPAVRPPRLETSQQLAVVALSQAPIQRRPWWPYGIAAAGVGVGIAGFMLGTRGSDELRVVSAPPLVAAAPPPAPAPPPALPASLGPQRDPVSKLELRFDATVPGASVTFRRDVLVAPATLEINESDIAEVVEVSAAGYKTERYWLTFDRPTHLTARLVKGTGLHEASDAETLVALGEVAAAEPPPEPAAEAARPRSHPATTPARRRIGRVAASQPRAANGAIAEPVSTPPAPGAPAAGSTPGAPGEATLGTSRAPTAETLAGSTMNVPAPGTPPPGTPPAPSKPAPSAPPPSAPGPSTPAPSAPPPSAPPPSTPPPSTPGPSTPASGTASAPAPSMPLPEPAESTPDPSREPPAR